MRFGNRFRGLEASIEPDTNDGPSRHRDADMRSGRMLQQRRSCQGGTRNDGKFRLRIWVKRKSGMGSLACE